MGNVYRIMRALWYHVISLRNTPFNIPGHLVDPLQIAFTKKYDMIFIDLYYNGALLNPHLIKI
jgi:hypothetical protein